MWTFLIATFSGWAATLAVEVKRKNDAARARAERPPPQRPPQVYMLAGYPNGYIPGVTPTLAAQKAQREAEQARRAASTRQSQSVEIAIEDTVETDRSVEVQVVEPAAPYPSVEIEFDE